jgi:hypothetical protein
LSWRRNWSWRCRCSLSWSSWFRFALFLMNFYHFFAHFLSAIPTCH